MNGWKITIVVLTCLIAQTSNAQYRLLKKGEPNPFDSAVAVRIDRYRLETKKLNLADQLVDSLKSELFKSLESNARRDTALHTMRSQIVNLSAASTRKDQVIDDLNGNIKAMVAVLPKKNLFSRNEVWFGAGVLFTIATLVIVR